MRVRGEAWMSPALTPDLGGGRGQRSPAPLQQTRDRSSFTAAAAPRLQSNTSHTLHHGCPAITHTHTHRVAIMEAQFPWQLLCWNPQEQSHTLGGSKSRNLEPELVPNPT